MAHEATDAKPHFPLSPLAIVIALIAIVAAIVVLRIFASAMTINITVNGTPHTIHGAKTVQTAITESGLPINPGDLISIRGAVLTKSAGKPFTAKVNGEEVLDANRPLHDGDKLELADGKDVVEDYDSSEEVTPHKASIDGAGAIRAIIPGNDGVKEIRSGKVSGETLELVKEEETLAFCTKYNPEVGADKVIALTFSGGPSDEYTSEILDILKENDAHATFFCVGAEIEKGRVALVRREREEGHQVCAGTYDHERSGDGSSVVSLENDEVVSQVKSSIDAISQAFENEKAGRIIRLPDGKLDEDIVPLIDSFADTEIGWNVDTGDWMQSDSSKISRELTSLEKGDIVRCHDGGGDQSATVEALREALPKLREKGYSFVTINDLMGYPAQ